MNSLEEEPAFIHRSVFPAMFKSVETLQEFLIIKEHLTSKEEVLRDDVPTPIEDVRCS